MNIEEFGRYLKDRRKVLKIDQRNLAELAGVSIHTLSNVESGKGNPTLEVVNKLLRVLGAELVIRPISTEGLLNDV